MAEGPKRSLAALGWNQPFEQALAALGSPGLVPARVAAQYTHLYRVWTEDADLLGSMVGRFRVEAESPADYPVVGDWVAVAEKEMERLRHGRSALDDYGAHDPVEFLGVAVEAFFEIPQVVRRRHRELYALLRGYFNQDPAEEDDARGLEE